MQFQWRKKKNKTNQKTIVESKQVLFQCQLAPLQTVLLLLKSDFGI